MRIRVVLAHRLHCADDCSRRDAENAARNAVHAGDIHNGVHDKNVVPFDVCADLRARRDRGDHDLGKARGERFHRFQPHDRARAAAEGDQAVHLSGVIEVFQHQLEGLDHDLHAAKPVGGIEVVFRVAAARGDRNVVDRRGKRRLVREACNVHGDDLAVKLPLHAFLEEFIFAALGIKRTERYNMLHAIRLISPLRLP